MRLIILKRAADAIAHTADWVETMNTDGAGDRWIERLSQTLEAVARAGVQYAICQNEELAKRNYRCFTYNEKWVIAYRIIDSDFVVYHFILGSKLV